MSNLLRGKRHQTGGALGGQCPQGVNSPQTVRQNGVQRILLLVGQHAHFTVLAACNAADGVGVCVKLCLAVRHMNEGHHAQGHALVAHGQVVYHGTHRVPCIGKLHGRNGGEIVVLVLLILPAGNVGFYRKRLVLYLFQRLIRGNRLNVDGQNQIAVEFGQFLYKAVLQIGRIVLEEQHPAHLVVGKLEVVRMELDAVWADGVLERVAALCYGIEVKAE